MDTGVRIRTFYMILKNNISKCRPVVLRESRQIQAAIMNRLSNIDLSGRLLINRFQVVKI